MCCSTMSEILHLAGERGLSAEMLPAFPGAKPMLQLVFRAVAASDVARFDYNSPMPVSLEMWVGFKYCPWCGRPVARWEKRWRGAAADQG
jgi:hypothetical protein